MSANAQPFIEFTHNIIQSSAISYFHNSPRWPTANNTFAFSTDYLIPVALTALIPFIFAVLLLLLLVIFVTLRFTTLYSKVNQRLRRLRSSKKYGFMLIPFSAILLLLIYISISFGLLGNAALNHSANDAIDIFNGLLNDLSRTGFAVVNTSVLLRDRLASFDFTRSNTSTEPVLVDLVGDLTLTALQTSQKFMLDRYPDAKPLRDSLQALVDNVKNVFNTVRMIMSIVYSTLFAIMLIIITAPPLLRIATISESSKTLSVISYILYLLIPCLLSYLLTGLLSAVGATVSDICISLHDYRTYLNLSSQFGNDAEAPEAFLSSLTYANVLIDSGFICPQGDITAQTLQQQIENTASSIQQSELASSTVELLLNTSASNVTEVAIWTANELPPYLNCSAQLKFSGHLEYVACGSPANSAINGVMNLWVAFILLAICLTVAVVASLAGVPVMRALDVWPTSKIIPAIPSTPSTYGKQPSFDIEKNEQEVDDLNINEPLQDRDINDEFEALAKQKDVDIAIVGNDGTGKENSDLDTPTTPGTNDTPFVDSKNNTPSKTLQ